MIIAVDFDGTLCVNQWPHIGAARTGVIDYVKRQKADGASLILWTNRTGDLLLDAVAWSAEHGITFDAVNENLPGIVQKFGGDTRKIYADIYLDDKSKRPEEIERAGGFRRMSMRGRT